MNKNVDIQLPSIPRTIMIIFNLAVGGLAVAAIVYFYNFHGEWGSKEDFGWFGDFMGGTLNPFLSFLTIALLIWSIRIQMHELKLTRNEMVSSNTQLMRTYKLQKNEITYRQISDALTSLYSDYELLWHRPIFKVYHDRGPLSLFEVIEDDSQYPDTLIQSVMLEINMIRKNQRSGSLGNKQARIILIDILHIVHTINELTANIYKLTQLTTMKDFYETNAKKLNKRMLEVGLYDQQTYLLEEQVISR